MDAANKVVRSRAVIRQVLIDFDNKNSSKLFGNGSACPTKPCGLEEGLDENGSPIVMQQEMEKEMASKPSGATGKKGKKGGASKGSTPKKTSTAKKGKK